MAAASAGRVPRVPGASRARSPSSRAGPPVVRGRRRRPDGAACGPRRRPRLASRPMSARRAPDKPGLRARTARGGVVNAAFLSGAEALVLAQSLLATSLLGPGAIGLYGV